MSISHAITAAKPKFRHDVTSVVNRLKVFDCKPNFCEFNISIGHGSPSTGLSFPVENTLFGRYVRRTSLVSMILINRNTVPCLKETT